MGQGCISVAHSILTLFSPSTFHVSQRTLLSGRLLNPHVENRRIVGIGVLKRMSEELFVKNRDEWLDHRKHRNVLRLLSAFPKRLNFQLRTCAQRSSDAISAIFLRKVLSSFVNGERTWESMSSSPAIRLFFKMGTTISDFTFALQER